MKKTSIFIWCYHREELKRKSIYKLTAYHNGTKAVAQHTLTPHPRYCPAGLTKLCCQIAASRGPASTQQNRV